MDTPKYEKKVHDIYPDVDDNSTEATKQHERKGSLPGIINHARQRPFHVPRVVSESYPAFKGKQQCALKIGSRDFEEHLTKSTGIAHLHMTGDELTICCDSQSKLSQQELSDLQKATHFDKKELQQWYKGRREGTWTIAA